MASAPTTPAPTPASKRVAKSAGNAGEMSVSAVPVMVSSPPANAQRRAECGRTHEDRDRVVRAETASSMLNRSPAAFPVSPA